MKKMALSVAACALLLLANEAEAQSVVRSGVIHFQGAIVESSYEITQATAMSTGESIKLIEVAPGVVIAVNMAFHGAGGSPPVFSTAFEVLKNTPPVSNNVSASKRGVLTISYR
ncbi:hypothetical protein ACJJU9_04385 [Pseudomonas helleri]|uniref:hypothetical protein n=1 Tax=Pseudomonas helleri TaxID=1608996 RepID=UPI00389B0086